MQTNKRILILNAGAPYHGSEPSLLQNINGHTVLDWLLNVFETPIKQFNLVLGYESDRIKQKYTELNIICNEDWKNTGSGASLLQFKFDDELEDLWVCYGDILFHKEVVKQLEQSDATVVVAWDSHWQKRFVGRDSQEFNDTEKVIVDSEHRILRCGQDISTEWASGEFIGLVRLRAEALEFVKKLSSNQINTLRKMHLSGVIEWMRLQGFDVVGVDVAGDWAEMNEPRDVAHFILGTKAETLSRLRGMVKSATIQEQVSFTVERWEVSQQAIVEQIQSKFNNVKVAVRSSAKSEDAFTYSNAGAYTSLLNIDTNLNLVNAINEVIASYQDKQGDDQVLIQPMIESVKFAGVVLTRTLEQGAPYYVINYDESGSTEGITSGKSSQHKVLYIDRTASLTDLAEPKLQQLLLAVKEIEALLGYDSLDMEFVIDQDEDVHILQVRPIAISQQDALNQDEKVQDLIESARTRFKELQALGLKTLGKKAIFGNMPDWNPAEIIGTNPGELAQSLYRYLILDDIWAQQRAESGYRDVRPQPLLQEFAGKPYIDVRACFNSFIPAPLSDELSNKLVDFYMQWLMLNPQLHDKIEFDVLPTCFSLNFERWQARLSEQGGFSFEEIQSLKDGLLGVTNNALKRTQLDLKKVGLLTQRQDEIIGRMGMSARDKVKLLLDDCRRYGTLPFAHLARSGFIAVTFLKEAVAVGVLSDKAMKEFLSCVTTESHKLAEDAGLVKYNKMEWELFIKRYGHLRPGTYDISSPTYAEEPELYLKPIIEKYDTQAKSNQLSTSWDAEKGAFFKFLHNVGIMADAHEIEDFMLSAIEGREKAKFIFSRSLSMALDLIAKWGQDIGVSRDQLSNLSIHTVLDTRTDESSIEFLKLQASQNKEYRSYSLACQLPPLLVDDVDFSSFVLSENQPNFIGSRSITAECVNLADINNKTMVEVEGKIILIPQADPGYDWLFGQGIVGLITMYGGANSHMAIRSAEFGLPAAIGIGETHYKKIALAQTLELDPAGGIIRIIHL
jgi:glutamine kinase